MDCWKGITQDARISSGYPYRDDNETRHNGVDIVSDRGGHGDGAPIRSFTSGKVELEGEDQWNGKYTLIKDSKGEFYKYIHMKEHRGLARGTLVAPGSLLGSMNCSGDCGLGDKRGDIDQTHVHVAQYTYDSAGNKVYKDPLEHTGGESCES